MRLTSHDLLATAAVAGAGTYYGLWATGGAGGSTRVTAAVVFVLGWGGCMSVGSRMGSAYGPAATDGRTRAYRWLVSLLGSAALLTGVLAVSLGSDLALAVLVAATGLLWAAATARHALEPVRPVPPYPVAPDRPMHRAG